MTGKLKPGDRLLVQKLATRLGIGQPTLREALKELEYQGLVRKGPAKGTYVSTLTADDLRNLLEVRVVLEALAIEQAVVHLTPQAESQLTAIVKAMAEADRDDLAKFHDADVAFHRRIWALAGNEYLTAALEGVAIQLFVFGSLKHGREAFLDAVRRHEQILNGLCSRDPQKARNIFVNQTLSFWNQADDLSLEVVA